MGVADDDPRGVEIVVQRTALAQEFGAEDDLLRAQPRPDIVDKADRDGRFDDHGGVRCMGLGEADDRLDRGCVEAVGVDVVIGRRRDDDVIGTGQCRSRVGRGGQVQRAAGQEIL